MQRLRLVAALLAALAPGCMKASALQSGAGVPVMVVPVAAVSGPPIAIGAAPDAPHPLPDHDDHSVGDRVEVAAHGSWLPATLIERRGDRWLVHYDETFVHGSAAGVPEEIVERERIRVPVQRVDTDLGPDDADP
jgi:hypothetical protein